MHSGRSGPADRLIARSGRETSFGTPTAGVRPWFKIRIGGPLSGIRPEPENDRNMLIRGYAVLLMALLVPGALAAPTLRLDDGKPQPADLAVRAQLQQRLDEIAADPGRYRDAMYEGEVRAAPLCKVCHGLDGISVRDGAPNLAGQDPVYMVEQFNRYADGRRIDFWMGSLASGFTDDDKIKLAIYYSEQKMRPSGGGDPSLIARGRELYGQYCVDCHGVDGRSKEGYARLAGQRPEYTIKMLREFRSASGKRFSPVMYARSYMLRTDQDITAVATFLAHLD